MMSQRLLSPNKLKNDGRTTLNIVPFSNYSLFKRGVCIYIYINDVTKTCKMMSCSYESESSFQQILKIGPQMRKLQ